VLRGVGLRFKFTLTIAAYELIRLLIARRIGMMAGM
jgi:hypothetical protein